jgi:hypothetical protein
MATVEAYLVGNTMKLQLGTVADPLTDPDTGLVVTSAAVTVTVVDAEGADVLGETWPLTLAHVAGGVYRGHASYLVEITKGMPAVAQFEALDGGKRYYCEVKMKGTTRTGETATT